jgi:hypothetical protein
MKLKKNQKKIISIIGLILIGIIVLYAFGFLDFGKTLAVNSFCPSGDKYCSSLSPDSKYTCNLANGQVTKQDCPTGQTCSSGDCINKCPIGTEQDYCSSIDTHAYFKCTLGTTYRYPCSNPLYICSGGNCIPNPSNCPSGEKYCSSTNTNSKFLCNLQTGQVTKQDCPTGQTCSSGDCIINPFNCPSGEKYCSSLMPVSIFLCNLQTGQVTKQDCSTGQSCDLGTCVVNPSNCPSGEKYCSSLSNISIYNCDKSTGFVTKSDCNKNILGVQFLCKDGNCINPEELINSTNVCESCDAFAFSTILGSVFKEKKCESKGWTLEWSFFFISPPQGETKCFLSFAKLLLTPIVFIFSLLFGLDYLTRFKTLKGKKKNIIKFLIALVVAGLMSYLIYTIFIVGIIVFVMFIIIKIGIKSIIR